MGEREDLIKELQADDEKSQLIAELQAHDAASSANKQQISYDPMNPPQYVPPETGIVSKAGTVLLNAGQMMNPWQDEMAGAIRGTIKTAKDLDPMSLKKNIYGEIDEVRDAQQNMNLMNPNSATTGKVAGFAGSMAMLPKTLAGQAALGSAQMSGAMDNGGVTGRTTGAVLGGALPVVINKILPNKTAAIPVITENVPKKAVGAYKTILKQFGFDNSEIRQAANGLVGKEVSASNPIIQLKTLVDEGVINANTKSTVDVANAIDDILPKNAMAKSAIIDGPSGQQVLQTGVAIKDLPFNPKLVSAKGIKNVTEQSRKLIESVAPNILDEAGNLRNMTLQEAQYAKEVLQDYRNFSADPSLAKFQQESFKVVEEHLRQIIEQASPQLGSLNKVSSAAITMKDKIIALENKGIDVSQGPVRSVVTKMLKSPLMTTMGGAGAGALVGPQIGLTRGEGAVAGMAIGGGYQMATGQRSLQQSLNAAQPTVKRSVNGILEYIKNNAPLLPPAIIQAAQKYESLPPDQQEQLAPLIFKQAEEAQIPVEPPMSGYASEVDGKLTDPNDVIKANQDVFKNKSLSVIERAKQMNLVNSSKQVPPSLMPPQAMFNQAEAEDMQRTREVEDQAMQNMYGMNNANDMAKFMLGRQEIEKRNRQKLMDEVSEKAKK